MKMKILCQLIVSIYQRNGPMNETLKYQKVIVNK